MITLSQLIENARGVNSNIQIRYLHPSLYLICEDLRFEGQDEEQRQETFIRSMQGEPLEIAEAVEASGIVLHLVAPSERAHGPSFLETAPKAHHWIEFLAHSIAPASVDTPNRNLVHFYGFKGGQARSTVLAMLSKTLADDGYRVLVVDVDIEAPSLHRQYGIKVTKLDSTLLGCILARLQPIPQPAYVPKSGYGTVDLVACRPSDPTFDLDHATLALNTALDPTILQDGFGHIIQVSSKYDVTLVDHRSGLGSSVLPVVAAYPGSVIAFARLDEQSDEAEAYFDILFSLNPKMPGLFVSFSLDPEDTTEKLLGRQGGRIDALLGVLAKAVNLGAERDGSDDSESVISGEDLLGYWVSWFHDRSFLGRISPAVEQLSTDNRGALSKIRELIGMQAARRRPDLELSTPRGRTSSNPSLTSSGNTDQGLLIQTEALRRLSVANSPFTYILGRKGTGKTRLVRTLIEKDLAIPLLAADDFPHQDVVKSADALFKDIVSLLNPSESEKLWWILLDAAASHPRDGRQAAIRRWYDELRQHGSAAVVISEISQRLKGSSAGRAYLIDGVETAFNSTQMALFVEGLFRFLSSVQSDPQLSQKCTIRLFIRTDLVRRAVENVEQQIEGRYLVLSWDTQSILNFALSRISDLDWFRSQFPETTSKLQTDRTRLEKGAVPETECNEFLLSIFPAKLRRNNLLTLTFLKDYFSEGIGDSASFYPRIYDTFLRSIAAPEMIKPKAVRMPQIEDGRVSQPLIIAAHDYASKEYLNQVVAELKNLVQLSPELKKNEDHVELLISAFSGLQTPFEFDKCLQQVTPRFAEHTEVAKENIRDALQLMKQIGIFEDRPGFAGWWRVGRLFKTALGMKYVR